MALGGGIKLKKSTLIEQINLAALKFHSTEVTCYIQDLQDFIFLKRGLLESELQLPLPL